MEPEDIKLFYFCTSEKYVVDENVVFSNAITYIYEGEFEMSNGKELIHLDQGSLFYTAKNTLFRFTKIGSKNKPFKSLTVVFSDKFLEAYFQRNAANLKPSAPDRNFQIKDHKLWNNFFASLQPYVEMQHEIPQDLIDAKQLEALSILRSLYFGIDHHLSHIGMPGKIDLEKFMQQNYLFNLSLQRFAYLTGRSLSTFQRDFLKIFATTPQRWLTQKRLELAHYLIKDKKLKPSDNTMRIAQEEIFGPVQVLIPYKTLDEAIAIANDSEYGLSGSVITRDINKGLEVAKAIRTGIFMVNAVRPDFSAPFGGFKQSGVGREFGAYGLHTYTELKTIVY